MIYPASITPSTRPAIRPAMAQPHRKPASNRYEKPVFRHAPKFAGRLDDLFLEPLYQDNIFEQWATATRNAEHHQREQREYDHFVQHGTPTQVLSRGSHWGIWIASLVAGHELDTGGHLPEHDPGHIGHDLEGAAAGHAAAEAANRLTEPLPAATIRALGIRKPALIAQMEECEQWAKYLESSRDNRVYKGRAGLLQVAYDSPWVWTLGHQDRFGLYEGIISPFAHEQACAKNTLERIKGMPGTSAKIIPNMQADIRFLNEALAPGGLLLRAHDIGIKIYQRWHPWMNLTLHLWQKKAAERQFRLSSVPRERTRGTLQDYQHLARVLPKIVQYLKEQ